jgi:nucleoside-diphosphate-sugar epimerase
VAILRRPGDDLTAVSDVADQVEHRLGDVRELASVRGAMVGARAVYHLAGVAVPLNALHRLMLAVNVGGTANVARAALEAGVQRLVHVSSAAAVGFPARGVVADERFAFNGARYRHSYAVTKWLGERVVLDHVARGLDAVVLNPSSVMAPGGSLRAGWAALLLRIEARSLPVYPGGGLGMTTRRDVLDALLKAMEKGIAGQRYIVNTVNLSYRELCATVAAVVGAPPPRVRAPDWLLRLVAQLNRARVAAVGGRDPGRWPLLMPENVPLVTEEHYYDQSKAVRELGICQSRLEEAVRETYQWCLARRGAGR